MRGAVCAIVASCAALLWPSSGSACTIAIGPSTQPLTRSVVSDGVVTVTRWCGAACDDFEPIQEIVVTDSTGATVAGEIVASGEAGTVYWAAFKPTEPWQPDEAYELQGMTPIALGGGSPGLPSAVALSVIDDATPAPAGLDVTAELSAAEVGHGPMHCCVDGARNSCTNTTQCFSAESRRNARLSVELGESAMPFVGQYVFEVEWMNPDAATQPADPGPGESGGRLASAMFETHAEEYCATVTVERWGDGETATFVKCAPHGDLPALGIVPANPVGTESTLQTCTIPPPEFHAEWCQLVDSTPTCDTPECAEARAACGSLAAPGSETPRSGSGADMDPTLQGVSSNGGCSIGVPHRPGRDFAVLGLFAGMLVATRRRYGRRRPR